MNVAAPQVARRDQEQNADARENPLRLGRFRGCTDRVCAHLMLRILFRLVAGKRGPKKMAGCNCAHRKYACLRLIYPSRQSPKRLQPQLRLAAAVGLLRRRHNRTQGQRAAPHGRQRIVGLDVFQRAEVERSGFKLVADFEERRRREGVCLL